MIRLSDPSLLKKIKSRYNQDITHCLKELIEYLQFELICAPDQDKQKHRFRILHIKRAIRELSKCSRQIQDGQDAMDLKGIGRGIGRRIDEIIKTGNLSEIQKPSPRLLAISKLMKIHGIGEKTAKKLVDQYQISSLDPDFIPDNILSKNTIAVIKADIKPLTRTESDQIFDLLENHIKSMYPDIKIYRCGSYRRGKQLMSDLDVLMVHPQIDDLYQGENCLLEIVLSAEFLTDHLCGPDRTRYMGIGFLNKSFRIDIRMLPYKSLPFGLLYFTGSRDLNKLLRIDAKRQGYCLNEYGLYQNSIPIDLQSERAIFEFLGFEYLKPIDRDI